MLSLNLTPIFHARGIQRPFTFLVKAGLPRHSIHNILSGRKRTFRLDHIEFLCRVLVCEPNDLLSYTPDSDHPITANHPLNNLKPTETPKAISETLATIPFKQLKEITNKINTTP